MISNVKNISNITFESSNHLGISKKVIFSNIETISNIRQIAYTEIAAGFEVEQHCHDTMEEFFIIVEGSCEFLLDGNKFLCSKDSIIRVAPKTIHSIKAITCSKVFYFGVAI